MNAVRLHQRRIQRNVLHEERNQGYVIVSGQLLIDAFEIVRIGLPVVWRYEHSGQNDVCSGRLAQLNHAQQIFANNSDWGAAQGVIAAQFDHDDRRRIEVESARQAPQTAGRGVSADTGIDHPITVTFPCQAVLQQRDPGSIEIDAESGAQAVPDNENRIASLILGVGDCGRDC